MELLVENEPVRTDNIRSVHLPTVRIYTVYEAQLIDTWLVQHLLATSEGTTDQDLIEQASKDARNGGKGRSNGVLTLPMEHLIKLYGNLPPESRNERIAAEGHKFEGNVPAILPEVSVPKYERFSF